ncbi:MAG: FUSC family protein [Cyanobacteria bacterium K_Offshore_surface_m2_011]|nr:FUSC family protein [Cyanobacteria bacterium K_Offshore_surface_m2_011]
MLPRPPSPQQIRNALQVGFAGFLAAGIHAAAGPDVNAIDGFYVVYGAARSLLPTPEASREAAWARIVGTVFGGAVVVLLTQALHNWLAIGVGYVLIQLLGRRLGLSPATLMNAVIMTVLILAVPAHERMGGMYVVDRTGWHLLGLLLGMAVERLFWFRSPLQRLEDSERGLLGRIDALLAGTSQDGAEELISAYGAHCAVRAAVLRSPQAQGLANEGMQQRHEALEQALRHAVAMVRVPAVLRSIDAEACREALVRLRSLAAAP